MSNLPTATSTRMCSECARDFEYTPGLGRPPLRCAACRADRTGKTAAVVPAKGRRAVVVEVAVHDAPPPAPLDIPSLQIAIGEEIAGFEEAIATRLFLLRALARYQAVNQAVTGTDA